MRWYAALARRLGTSRWFPPLARPWLAKTDLALLRISGGRLRLSPRDFPFLILETTGFRTGTTHRVPLYYAEHRHGLVVGASNFGSRRLPDWARNLRDQPAASVEIARRRISVRARELDDPAERTAAWIALDAVFPGYAAYRRRAPHPVPLFALALDTDPNMTSK